MAKTSKAAQAAAGRYQAAKYDQIRINVPKGRRAELAAAAKAAGASSLSSWLLGLAERETGLDLVLRGELPYKRKTDGGESETEK